MGKGIYMNWLAKPSLFRETEPIFCLKEEEPLSNSYHHFSLGSSQSLGSVSGLGSFGFCEHYIAAPVITLQKKKNLKII